MYSLSPSLLTADKKALSLTGWLAIALLAIAFFLPGLVSMPPTDRDESLFAQASKQMIESSNYSDIRIQNEPRYKKPIGIYWLQAASEKIFNPDHLNQIWAYRIPSFIAGIVTVLMTAALGSLFFGPVTGFMAAVMMAGCLMLNAEARLAKTDATLLACTVVAQYALARAYLKKVSGYGMPFLFWTALAVGILIKGPIILLIVLSTLLWLRLTEKNLKWFGALEPGFGVFYMALLVMPWLIIIGITSHGDFYQQSAGHDMFGKILKGEFRGMMPPGLHLLVSPLTFFPFSIYALLAIPDVWKNRKLPAIRFCLGWIIPAWIIFELSLTKLPHYTLPMFPAIALLSAKVLNDGYEALEEHRWLPPIALAAWLMVGTGLALAPVILTYMMNDTWNILQIVTGALLLIAQGIAIFYLFKRNPNGVYVLAVANLLFMACVFNTTLPNLHHLWLSREIVQMAEPAKPCDKLSIISATYNEPSFIFLAGTDTEFTADGKLAAAGLKADACKLALTDNDHDERFQMFFKKAKVKPTVVGTIQGFNAGRGNSITLTLYAMPKK